MSPDNWSDWWRKRRAGLTAFGGIAVFFSLFFARVFINHRFIITGDAFYYTYPLRTVAWNMIRSGSAPLWTPLLLSGYPLISVPLLAVGYPVTWTHLFLPGHWAEQIYALAPFLLSPLTTYAYAREIGRSRLASVFAGLSFGYGGMMCGILANSGMLTNGFIWCPLLLLFIERARKRSFAHCLLWATVAYSMSVLAGHGQSYVYSGVLGLAYGLFTSLHLASVARDDQAWWRGGPHWRPLMVAVGAILLSGAVAAFQLFETVRVARLSVRSALSYEVFSEGSFTLREAFLSLGAQLYHYIDTGTYVTPLALVLAVVALGFAIRHGVIDARIWFWAGVAVVAFLMLLGSNTPLNRLLHNVPVINMFRVPSRHTFEWTLAISILAAFGWDATASLLKNQRERASRMEIGIVLGLLALTAAVGVFWWRAIVQWPEPHPTIYTALPERSYWLWKLAFTALLFVLAWRSFRIATKRSRQIMLIAVIGLACFVEANATVTCWWAGFVSLPAQRF
ncbi:MAG TPA: hypothetical protein VGW36_04900, partial [Pyrinomonadaceae bacterium]|nr:hypothetical protein [Pyrinomonadaceae bacterium]